MNEPPNEEERYNVTGMIIHERSKAYLLYVVRLNQLEVKPSKHWIPRIAILEKMKITEKLYDFRIEAWKIAEIKKGTNGKPKPQGIDAVKLDSKNQVGKNDDLESLLPLVEEMVSIKIDISELEDNLNQLNRKKNKIQRQLIGMVPKWVDYCKSRGKGRTFSLIKGFSKINFTFSVSHKLRNESDLLEKLGEEVYKTEKKLKNKTELRRQFGEVVLMEDTSRITIKTNIQEHHPKFVSIAHRDSMTSLIDIIFDEAISDNNLLNLVSMMYISEDRMDEVLTDCGKNNGHPIRKVGNFSYFKRQIGAMDIIYVFQGDEKLGHEYYTSVFNYLRSDHLMEEYCNNGKPGIIEGRYQDRFNHIIWSCLGRNSE